MHSQRFTIPLGNHLSAGQSHTLCSENVVVGGGGVHVVFVGLVVDNGGSILVSYTV